MDPKLVEITEHARRIGSRPDYVQGGGGNVSIKLNANTMAIKASGYRLEDIYPEDGIVTLDHTKLEKFFKTKTLTDDLDLLIKENESVVSESIFDTNNTDLKPSIETGFHAILGESVIHTHSVYVNTLTCTKEGQELLSSLFPESIYIPYKTPGVALTLTIRIACIEKKK
jgi:rhamnose utilization protein RhaD (predicted bifunctional aldolase and dehydrogenase)